MGMEWLEKSNLDPKTNELLKRKDLIPNRSLKTLIDDFNQKNKNTKIVSGGFTSPHTLQCQIRHTSPRTAPRRSNTVERRKVVTIDGIRYVPTNERNERVTIDVRTDETSASAREKKKDEEAQGCIGGCCLVILLLYLW